MKFEDFKDVHASMKIFFDGLSCNPVESSGKSSTLKIEASRPPKRGCLSTQLHTTSQPRRHPALRYIILDGSKLKVKQK
jgi:hypothetical protein